jgi:hypothetical protein
MEYLTDGITESLTNSISRLPKLCDGEEYRFPLQKLRS